MNSFIQTFISQICLELAIVIILNICIFRYTVFIYSDANVILTFSYNSVEKNI